MSLTRFDEANDIVILENPSPIVTSTWSTNDNNLDTNFTSSIQSASVMDVYCMNLDNGASDGVVQNLGFFGDLA